MIGQIPLIWIPDESAIQIPTIWHKLVIVMCKVDWNIGLRRCPEKMSSLRGPTLKKKFLLFSVFYYRKFCSPDFVDKTVSGLADIWLLTFGLAFYIMVLFCTLFCVFFLLKGERSGSPFSIFSLVRIFKKFCNYFKFVCVFLLSIYKINWFLCMHPARFLYFFMRDLSVICCCSL